jgi:hypothetical protein
MFSVAGSIFDWDFFFTHRKARLFVAILNRDGVRIFYALLGLLLIVAGVVRLLNVPLLFVLGI